MSCDSFAFFFGLVWHRWNFNKWTKMYQQKPWGSCYPVHWSEIMLVRFPLLQSLAKHLNTSWLHFFQMLGYMVVCPNIKRASNFVAAPGQPLINVCVRPPLQTDVSLVVLVHTSVGLQCPHLPKRTGLGPDQRLRPLHWVVLILLVWHCLHVERFSEGG